MLITLAAPKQRPLFKKAHAVHNLLRFGWLTCLPGFLIRGALDNAGSLGRHFAYGGLHLDAHATS